MLIRRFSLLLVLLFDIGKGLFGLLGCSRLKVPERDLHIGFVDFARLVGLGDDFLEFLDLFVVALPLFAKFLEGFLVLFLFFKLV